MKVDGNITLQGDIGTKTGKAKLAVPGMSVEDYASVIGKLQAYHAALVAAQLTETSIGGCKPTYNDEVSAVAPGTGVNVDRKLIVLWHTTTDSTQRTSTISGVPAVSTGITQEQEGERLNITGRGAMAAALEAVYGLSADTVIVDQGYVIQSK